MAVTITPRTVSDITSELERGALEIPRFQRSVVWPDKKKKDLISSIQRGYPIGAILVWEPGVGNGNRSVVIDGLQRTSALHEFAREPLAFIDVSTTVDDPLIRSLFVDHSGFPLNWESQCRQSIEDFLRLCRAATATAGFTTEALKEAVLAWASDVGDLDDRVSSEAIYKLYDVVRDVQSQVEGYVVPMIIFDGSEDDLPRVFEKINTAGTTLSKYEIFGAQWFDTRVADMESEVIEIILGKYQDLIDRGFEVPGLPGQGETLRPNLFESLFGLGKIWCSRYPLLFDSSEDPTHIEEVAFSLIPLALNVPLNKVGEELPKRLLRDSDGVYQINEVIDGLVRSIEMVNSALAPFIGIKLNKQTKTPDACLSEWQVISMIARAFVGRYSVVNGVVTERKQWKADWELLSRQLPAHVVSDVATGRWAGPLLQIARERVWGEEIDGQERSVSPYYVQAVSREELSRELTSMLERDRLNRKSRQRPHVRSDDKTLLRVIYSDVVTVAAEYGLEEIDHIYPVSRLVAIIQAQELDEGWPISHIANLALFPKPTNREKSAMTIAEYIETPDGDSRREEIARRLFLSPPDCAIHGDTWGTSDFHHFLEKRSEILVSRIVDRVCTK